MADSTPQPGKQKLWRRRRTHRAVTLAAIFALVVPAVVLAQSGYVSTWSATYPSSTTETTSGRNGCQVCHGPTNGTLNAYGAAVFSAPGGPTAEGVNSDGDPGGYTNLAEINAGAQPGWTVGNNNTLYDVADGTTVVSTGNAPPATITGPIDPVAAPTPTPTPTRSRPRSRPRSRRPSRPRSRRPSRPRSRRPSRPRSRRPSRPRSRRPSRPRSRRPSRPRSRRPSRPRSRRPSRPRSRRPSRPLPLARPPSWWMTPRSFPARTSRSPARASWAAPTSSCG